MCPVPVSITEIFYSFCQFLLHHDIIPFRLAETTSVQKYDLKSARASLGATRPVFLEEL
jgi:hypothetical protein